MWMRHLTLSPVATMLVHRHSHMSVGLKCLSMFPAVAGLHKVDVSAVITEADISRFAEDGAIVLRQVLSPAWVEALRATAEDNMQRPGPLCDEHAVAQGTGGRFHDDQFLWRRHDVCHEYVVNSGIGALAARAMRSHTAHILYDQLFVKEPGTSAPTPWHNDTSYWHVKGEQICSIWAALDVVTRERGLSYVKGSHRWGLVHAVTNFSGAAHSERNVYSDAVDLPPVPDVDSGVARGDFELLNWDMEPGDVLLFYSAMLHGAPGNPNSSAHRRRGYATRWCGDDIVFDERPGTMHVGWKSHGFDCGLSQGDSIGCELHPNVVKTVPKSMGDK
mmetsp:Transcript_75565/g.126019  ORF Transcript_75565/g.126019 Transcript_75565/m.126019 type:complete len:332 (+) Transcript_75565:163-1158(+)